MWGSFAGRARITDVAVERDRVFNPSHEKEREVAGVVYLTVAAESISPVLSTPSNRKAED